MAASPRLTRILGALAVTAGSLVAIHPAAEGAAQERIASAIYTKIGAGAGKSDEIVDEDFFKAIQEKLGGKYQNLQIVVTACKSGGFASAAGTRALANEAWSVTAAAEITKCESFGVSNVNKWTSGAVERTDGLSIEDKNFLFGFGPQWLQKLKSTHAATARQLAEHAQANQIGTISALQFRAKNVVADSAKIHDGLDASYLGFWQSGLDIGTRHNPILGSSTLTYKIFREEASYDSVDIDCALEDFKDVNISLDMTPYAIIPNRLARRVDLFDMIAAIGTRLGSPAGAPRKKVLLWIRAHGNSKTIKAELDAPPGPGLLTLQGRVYDATHNALSLAMTPDMIADFFEGHGNDNPELESIGRPTLTIATSQESPGIGPVNVSINGVAIGSIAMAGSSLGGFYELALPDGALDALRNSNSFTQNGNVANVTFSIPSGWFRVATQEDFDAGDLPCWGIGLAGPGLQTVSLQYWDLPMNRPAGLGLLATSLLSLGLWFTTWPVRARKLAARG